MNSLAELLQFAAEHPRVVMFAVGYFLFCNCVSSLPDPKPEERWYGFLHKFLHMTAGNAARVIPALRFSNGDKKEGV